VPSLPVPHEDELPPLPRSGASPAEIRASLHPEYRDEFDRDYAAAIKEAAESFELSGLLDVVEHWRMRAWVTRDPDEHRRVVRRAAQLLTGEVQPDDEPVAVTESRL
jgi:hypothetical protein